MPIITENAFFALWKYTFKCQLRVLFEHLGKTVQVQVNGRDISGQEDEFDDFCLYVYQMCPELIDDSQN